MKNSFLTVTGNYNGTTVIEKSKFICYLSHVESEESARDFIANIRKKHFDATHNCWAYISDAEGLVARFSDDGEPQGTAGVPMLEALKNAGLSQVVAVVTRYFGGVKLGAGGLVRAYGGCVTDAVKNVTVSVKSLAYKVVFHGEYDKFNLFTRLFNQNAKQSEADFSDGVTLTAFIKKDYYETFLKKLDEITGGKTQIKIQDEEYFIF